MKNKIIILLILIIILIFMFSKALFSNILGLITEKEYFIPKESSIFTFEPTIMNNGSGDWWLYGEDKKFYYGLNIESRTPKYYKLEKGKESKYFDKTNYKTWFENY